MPYDFFCEGLTVIKEEYSKNLKKVEYKYIDDSGYPLYNE